MSRSDILLEAGSNELELLLFELPGALYGVNVAKVREVILPTRLTPMPESRPEMEGVLNLRGKVVPIVSLRKYFGMPPAEDADDQRIIVMEFSDVCVGFVVDRVDKIHRISWDQLSPVPEEAISAGAAFTALAQIEEQIVLLVDFESVMIQLGGTNVEAEVNSVTHSADRSSSHILLADDSATMRNLINSCLTKAGYEVTAVPDGQQAWDILEEQLKSGSVTIDLVVSDIEMPGVDGLHLTKRIKESPGLDHIPVVLFSSLITPDNLKKGKMVGADHQISKPNMSQIPEVADKLLAEAKKAAAVPA